ncbi:MAG: hypothetical protein ACQES2_09395 [Pseudomonadota bacterium]
MSIKTKQALIGAGILLCFSLANADERAALDAQSQKLKEAFVDMARQVEGDRSVSSGLIFLGIEPGLRVERVQLQLNGTTVSDERVSALSNQALTLGGYMPLIEAGQLKKGGYQYRLQVQGRSEEGSEAQVNVSGQWQLGEQRKPLVLQLKSAGDNRLSLVERSS